MDTNIYLKHNLTKKILNLEGEYDYLFQSENTNFLNSFYKKINKGWSIETNTNITKDYRDNILTIYNKYGDIFDGFQIIGDNISTNYLSDIDIIYNNIILTKIPYDKLNISNRDNKVIVSLKLSKLDIFGYNPIFIYKIQYENIKLRFSVYLTNYKIEGIFLNYDILKCDKLFNSNYILTTHSQRLNLMANNTISLHYNYITISGINTNTCNYITSISIHNKIMDKLFRIHIYIDTIHIWSINFNDIEYIDTHTIRLEIDKNYRYDLFLNNNVILKLEYSIQNTGEIDSIIKYECINEVLYKNGMISLKRLGIPLKILSLNDNFCLTSSYELIKIVCDKTKPPNICPITHEEFVTGEYIKICDKCQTIFKKSALDIWLSKNTICPYARCNNVYWKNVKIP